MSFAPTQLSPQRLRSFANQLKRRVQATPGFENVRLSQCQEWVSQMFGFANWHEAVVTLKPNLPTAQATSGGQFVKIPHPLSDVVVRGVRPTHMQNVCEQLVSLGHQFLAFQAETFRSESVSNSFVLNEHMQAAILIDFLRHATEKDSEALLQVFRPWLLNDGSVGDQSYWRPRAMNLLGCLLPLWDQELFHFLSKNSLNFSTLSDFYDAAKGLLPHSKTEQLGGYLASMKASFGENQDLLEEQHGYLVMFLVGAVQQLLQLANLVDISAVKDCLAHKGGSFCMLPSEHSFTPPLENFVLRRLLSLAEHGGTRVALIEWSSMLAPGWLTTPFPIPRSMSLVLAAYDEPKEPSIPGWAHRLDVLDFQDWIKQNPA